jgi:hypothetical protein
MAIISGCAANQHTLDLNDAPRPVLFSEQISPSLSIDSNLVTAVQSVSCYSNYEKEDETVSEGKNTRFSSATHDHVRENISIKIDSVLQKSPNRFIGNVKIVAEVDRGISLGAIFSAILGSQITGGSSSVGVYNDQSFEIKGTIYQPIEDNHSDED